MEAMEVMEVAAVMVAVVEVIKMLRLMKKLLLAVLVLLVSAGYSLIALAADKEIVILYTNDVHCGIEDNEGYARLAQYKKDLLAQTPYVALVDAGDAIQGAPIGSLSQGEVVVKVMNAVGYDFAVPGNHEFDYGMKRLLELKEELACGYYSCNFVDAYGKAMLPAYKVMNFGDTKVGFIGVTTPETLNSSNPAFFQDAYGNYIYGFNEDADGKKLYATLQRIVDEVGKQADYVVLVAHLGMAGSAERWSSEAVAGNVSGIDVIIDGHSHEVNPASLVPNKDGGYTLVTQTGTKLQNIGQLTIGADGMLNTKLISGLTAKDSVVEGFIANEKAAFEKILQQPLGEALVPLYTTDPVSGKRLVRSQECNMGDLVADALRKVLDTDIALANGGGIRKDIAKGIFTYKDVLEVLPFGNMCAVKRVKGQQLLDALEMSAHKLPEGSGGFLQVSGMTYTIDSSLPSKVVLDEKGNFVKVEGAYRVQDVMVAGKPLDLEKTYLVGGNTYILRDGGNGMVMFNLGELVADDNLSEADALIEYVQNHLNAKVGEQYANPYGEGRITIK